jgi:hypothetical protein
VDAQREWFEKDYYAVLGVPADASQKDITKAYRKLARENHPDTNKGDAAAEERFKEISAAYDVVGDTDKRAKYDEVRRLGPVGGGFGGAPGGGFGGGGFSSGDVGDLGDLLGNLFGRGVIDENQGLFSFSQPCPRCGGNGMVVDDPCHNCGGSGVERRPRTVKVKIPAGVTEHVVRGRDLLEALLRDRVAGVRVGVVLLRQLAVSARDLLLARVVRHAELRVVVLLEPLPLRSHGQLARVTRTIAGRSTRPFRR